MNDEYGVYTTLSSPRKRGSRVFELNNIFWILGQVWDDNKEVCLNLR
jgi:hypothetical protein